MITRRAWAVYGILGLIWALLLAWQTAEHLAARQAAKQSVVDHGRHVTTTCGRLMRARSYSGVVNTERLEAWLNALVDTNELRFVELLNTNGDVLASAGETNDMPHPSEIKEGESWGEDVVLIYNPVDLGTNVSQLILPWQEMRLLEPTNGPPPTNGGMRGPPPNMEGRPPEPDGPPPPRRRRYDWRQQGRPYWMNESEYKSLLEKKGAHAFVVAMSALPAREAIERDLWVRVIIALLGTAAVAGYGLAWRSLEKTSELQVRLVRASELNLHLKELNVAAAGLAHETRNPLNIIRGLAQLVSKEQGASPEIQSKSRDIISQTDRVTAQLNEFINYSRPREVRRAPTDLNAVAAEVVRTLNYDLEEKGIDLQLEIEPLVIEADEQLLRQTLFNLVLNSIQAVSPKGSIRIRGGRRTTEEAFVEIADNGPGVPVENRAEIFKPYFTTNEEGTGLGLAVVQQIVLAHGWEIACLANEPAGALFRISHVKVRS